MFALDTSHRYQLYQLSNALIAQKGLQQIGFHFGLDFVYKPKLIIMIFFRKKSCLQYLLLDNRPRYAFSN